MNFNYITRVHVSCDCLEVSQLENHSEFTQKDVPLVQMWFASKATLI